MTSTEIVKKICKERKIPLSHVEKSCGFANGYLGRLKKELPVYRAKKVADYLVIPLNQLLPAYEDVSSKTVNDIKYHIDMVFDSIDGDESIIYAGKKINITDDNRRILRYALEIASGIVQNASVVNSKDCI